MVQPLRSPPVTGGSSLLRAGPPARLATVLDASQFLLLDALPLAAGHVPTAVSRHAFSPSVQKPQIRLASPSCRTPPGQQTGTRQAHPEATEMPRFRCRLELISARHQRFTCVRLPDPHLTHLVRLFLIAHNDGLQPTLHEVV